MINDFLQTTIIYPLSFYVTGIKLAIKSIQQLITYLAHKILSESSSNDANHQNSIDHKIIPQTANQDDSVTKITTPILYPTFPSNNQFHPSKSNLKAEKEPSITRKLLSIDNSVNFNDLPEEIKNLIYGHLSFEDSFLFREISQNNQHSFDEYMNAPTNQFNLILHLAHKSNEDSRTGAAYNFHLERILKNDKLPHILEANPTFRNHFIDHFTSLSSKIEWDYTQQYEEQVDINCLPTLSHLIFTYASDEQLTIFLNWLCKQSKDHSKRRFRQVFAQTFFNSLTQEYVERIIQLPKEDSKGIISLLRYYIPPSDFSSLDSLSWLASLYKALPDSNGWSKIKEIRYSKYDENSDLPACLIALDIIHAMEQLNWEKILQDKIDELFGYKDVDTGLNGIVQAFPLILPTLESLDDEKISRTIPALTLICGKYQFYFSYAKMMMEKASPRIFTPFLQEYFQHILSGKCHDPMDFIHNILPMITSKQHAIAYILACQKLPDPLQTFFLRCLAHGTIPEMVYNDKTWKAPFIPMSDAFTEAGLKFKQYEPWKLPINGLRYVIIHPKENFFLPVLTKDKLNNVLDLILNDQNQDKNDDLLREKELVLRLMMAGIRINDERILSPTLDKQDIEEIFEQKGLKTENYHHPLTLEELLVAGVSTFWWKLF